MEDLLTTTVRYILRRRRYSSGAECYVAESRLVRRVVSGSLVEALIISVATTMLGHKSSIVLVRDRLLWLFFSTRTVISIISYYALYFAKLSKAVGDE